MTTIHETSLEAWLFIKPHCSELQWAVLECFGQQESRGLTDWELNNMQRFVQGSYAESTVRKRRTDLSHAGVIVDSGRRRQGGHSTAMVVWELSASVPMIHGRIGPAPAKTMVVEKERYQKLVALVLKASAKSARSAKSIGWLKEEMAEMRELVEGKS